MLRSFGSISQRKLNFSDGCKVASSIVVKIAFLPEDACREE